MSVKSPDGEWTGGGAYEQYVGRWSRLVAREFITWLQSPPDASWLDVGCGTGELARMIGEMALPFAITGVDRSAEYIAYAAEQPSDGITYRVGDATALPVESNSFDVTVSGLVLNFVSTPGDAVAEMIRATRAGGVVAAYVWDYADGMQLMRYFWDAAIEIDPAAADLDEGARFRVCREGALADLFATAGLRDVKSRGIVVPTPFSSFDDYWRPFLGAQGPAPGFAMSLAEDRRETLRANLKQRLPANADGSIKLTARAWAARGTVPS
jgi:SAM-dependent methyltransferase